VKVVSERAGHASIAITLQIYGHAIPGMQRDLADRMDASLRGVLQNAE
jgi:integrase